MYVSPLTFYDTVFSLVFLPALSLFGVEVSAAEHNLTALFLQLSKLVVCNPASVGPRLYNFDTALQCITIHIYIRNVYQVLPYECSILHIYMTLLTRMNELVRN